MISVLFARVDSVYKDLGCDVWDIDRDARKFDGTGPVICHPPCRSCGSLRMLAKPLPGEKELSVFAVGEVRRCGDVLEHPRASTLWEHAGLPAPCRLDVYGGWTLPVDQYWWGHEARKRTFLYVVGVMAADVPSIPLVLGRAPKVIGSPSRLSDGSRKRKGCTGWRPSVDKNKFDVTPPEFAAWLIELAGRCSVKSERRAA